MRSHRVLLGIGALLVLAATLRSTYSALHGLEKLGAAIVSAGVGAYIIVWLLTWPAAALSARRRQLREALYQLGNVRDSLAAGQKENERIRVQLEDALADVGWLSEVRDTAFRDRDAARGECANLQKELEERRREALELSEAHRLGSASNLKLEAEVRSLKAELAPFRQQEKDLAELPAQLDELMKKALRLRDELIAEIPDVEKAGSISLSGDPALWEKAEAFEAEARRLLIDKAPYLLVAFANGANASLRRQRQRELALDKNDEKMPNALKLKRYFERAQERPANYVETCFEALVYARKELGR
ncbi:MAG: hypothetical protein QOG85_198 [Gaiellaceae bacterium]|jgi:chromosome segregation ATPase|nr:hypothetical protein [Gaiellaceae bacterium]